MRSGDEVPSNPVNSAVVSATIRVIAIPQIWLERGDGSIARAWAPTEASRLHEGDSVEVYLAIDGSVNGWQAPTAGVAVNQRLLDRADPHADGGLAVCEGTCGVTWIAPDPVALAAREHCLTCAGPLRAAAGAS